MKFQELLLKSKLDLENNPLELNSFDPTQVFNQGAKWMHGRMFGPAKPFDSTIRYSSFGWFKYGLSFLIFILSLYSCYSIHPILTPVSILAFYWVEVHFLFLFPILLDKKPNPIRTSFKATYCVGIFTSLVNVVPIGFYMMIGLLNFKKPLKNWYIGCNAILIWYQDEVRNRI